MDQLTITEHDARLNLWIQRIKECLGSGMTVKAWCKAKEINEKTYYYWLRKIKKEAFEALPSECRQVPKPFGERKVFAEVHTSRPAYTENVADTVDIADVSSFASPSTVAWVIHQKYELAVPLYRQEKEWEQMGVKLSRATMANWIMVSYRDWLSPVVGLLKKKLLKHHINFGSICRFMIKSTIF